ncbi:MAG: ABC transporter substrate-binding protein [Cyclonatronaceae bacterium]
MHSSLFGPSQSGLTLSGPFFSGSSNSGSSVPATLLATIGMIVSLMVLASCGPSTETIVVGGEARGPGVTDEEAEPEVREADLPVLRIGEPNRIRSMDPLFAQNTASKRLVTLAYEGLVRFDQDDSVVPAAARQWTVSDDSLTYTFHLRRNLFFHDDESFAQGRGRRVNSRDVVRIFERMASRDVPPEAAGLFTNSLLGFEPFYLEQREIFFDDDRKINRIEGLEAKNDSTVVFQLVEPDHHFLAKLASPYAVLYPAEAFTFREDGLHNHAVGTGPYRYESSIGDSIRVFLRHAHYYGQDDQGRQLPLVSRIELMNVTDDARLYRHFRRGRLDLILDPGPDAMRQILGPDLPDAEESGADFRLEQLPNPDPIVLRFNPDNRYGLGRSDAASVLRAITPELLATEWEYPALRITYRDEEFTQSNIGRVFRRFGQDYDNRLLFAFSRNQYPRAISRFIHQNLDANLQVDLEQRNVFSSDIFFYLDYVQSVIPDTVHERRPGELLRLERDRYLLHARPVEGIRTNSLSWWLDLRQIRKAQHL